MGIYIKNMEMPIKGYRLILIHADGTVQTTGGETTAISVPPHGRLIDADAVERNLVKLQMAQKSVVGHGIRKSRAVVRDMETIIPAEESNMDSFIHIFEEDNEEDGMDSFIRILKD